MSPMPWTIPSPGLGGWRSPSVCGAKAVRVATRSSAAPRRCSLRSSFGSVATLRLTRARLLRGELVEPLRRTAQTLWPDGLPLADPNIPNRDPLAGFPVDQGDFGDGAALLRSAEVRPAFDPLLPRPALGRWHAGHESDVDEYVRGIADFIAPADVGLIDLRLQQLRTAASRRVVRAHCRVEESTRGATIECAAAPSLRVNIRLTAAGEKAATGIVSKVVLAGASLTRSLKLDPAHRQATRALRSTWTYRGAWARLSDSTAIEGIALRWANTEQLSAEVELQLADDVPTLDRAVDALARQARLGRDDALGEAAVRRAALLRGLSRNSASRRHPAVATSRCAACRRHSMRTPRDRPTRCRRHCSHSFAIAPPAMTRARPRRRAFSTAMPKRCSATWRAAPSALPIGWRCGSCRRRLVPACRCRRQCSTA